MKKYLITYSDNETDTVSAASLLQAQKIAHGRAAKMFRCVKAVVLLAKEPEPDFIAD